MPPSASPFPQIHLSTDEREMLIRTANDLVNQAQEKYEWFLWQDRERLDQDRWRLVRDQEDMSVYVDRQLAESSNNRNMQCLLTTGSVPGKLHDAMYGTLNTTTDAMKIKTAYVQDTLVDGAVLETILAPTPELPFQSLTLRWFAKGVPLPIRAVTKKHADNVSIEATGTRRLYDGEQIGFYLTHSVILAETPPLPQYQRCNVSICTFWRQISPQRVHAYMTSYVEIPDSCMLPFQIKSIADAFVSESKTTHCAKMKKLAWLMQQDDATTALDGAAKESAKDTTCYSCGFKCPAVFKATVECAVCSKPTCASCRVKNEIFTLTPDAELIKTKLRVCHPCMKTVDQLDSASVAQQEATIREKQGDSALKESLAGDLRLSTASSVNSSVSTESNSG